MKKMFAGLVALAGFTCANSQNLSLGPVASFNISSVTGDSHNRVNKPGFKAGATITYSVDPHWAIGSDVVFSNEGVKYKYNTIPKVTSTTNLNYVRVPLKAIYFFNKLGDKLRPKVYLGPSFGFMVGGQTKLEEQNMVNGQTVKSESPSSNNFKNFDFGVMAGAGLNYRIARATWLNLDINYTNGLVDISKSASSWNANRNLGIALGVAFPIGTVQTKK